MKLFQKINMASETNHAFMRSGVATEALSPGDLVVPTTLVESSVYGTPNHSTFTVSAPATVDGLLDANTYIVDVVKSPEATNGDLVYRVGGKTLGLKGNKGEIVSLRKLVAGDLFVVGAKNFEVEPTVANGFYTVKANDFRHAVAAVEGEGALTAANYIAKLVEIKNISQGVGSAGNTKGFVLLVVKA